jgi:hypothetical protein
MTLVTLMTMFSRIILRQGATMSKPRTMAFLGKPVVEEEWHVPLSQQSFSPEQQALSTFFQNGKSVAAIADPEGEGGLDASECAEVCAETAHQVVQGNLDAVEGMLVAQAITLDTVFNSVLQQANRHLQDRALYDHIAMNEADRKKGYPHLEAAEKLMRMALKAQAQSAKTLETLATLKNPTAVAFVRQANIGQAVQVNNSAPEPTRARGTRGSHPKTDKRTIGG